MATIVCTKQTCVLNLDGVGEAILARQINLPVDNLYRIGPVKRQIAVVTKEILDRWMQKNASAIEQGMPEPSPDNEILDVEVWFSRIGAIPLDRKPARSNKEEGLSESSFPYDPCYVPDPSAEEIAREFSDSGEDIAISQGVSLRGHIPNRDRVISLYADVSLTTTSPREGSMLAD